MLGEAGSLATKWMQHLAKVYTPFEDFHILSHYSYKLQGFEFLWILCDRPTEIGAEG